MASSISNFIFPSKPCLKSSASSLQNETYLKRIQKIALSSFIYLKDALKFFAQDLFSSFFSFRIITKIPFFIFFYGFWTAFGAIDTIYYVALTVLVLKGSKDLIASLKKRDKLKSISEYLPLDDKLKTLKNIIKGIVLSPALFYLDKSMNPFIEKMLNYLNLKTFKFDRLIYQKGFVGNFATFYAILIYPVIKEILFNGYIKSYFSEDKKNKNPNNHLNTVIKTALVFGIYHFSPTIFWMNVPSIIFHITLGAILALLNKETDIWTSLSCHMAYSCIATLNDRKLKFG
ncbi:MAG: hypothetical protein K940chlam1_01026 [Candidatus Anoxychlamydiales bacterium]|nr:hypothetical protein [Candidatus Anoxychlamydiales bacterium]NGX36741.1 hypothetical protein [Candidatus Anoxychlamydiales bacterium]